ncbi:MAG TPA: type II secretion system protein [Candidatus Bathyarchaeia archaeon]|nr:type II secretion system protein [Candidatus Bathyarchaeia archaeon]
MIKKRQSGFTLIELLVVMNIIAILLGLSLVSFQGARKTARDGKRKVDLEEIRSALEMCRTDTGTYPSGDLLSEDSITCGTPSTNYLTIPFGPSGTGDIYRYTPSGGSNYTVCAENMEIGGPFCLPNP